MADKIKISISTPTTQDIACLQSSLEQIDHMFECDDIEITPYNYWNYYCGLGFSCNYHTIIVDKLDAVHLLLKHT